jgi:hypothetical protein
MGVIPAEAADQLGHSVEMFLRTYSEYMKEYSDSKGNEKLQGAPLKSKAQLRHKVSSLDAARKKKGVKTRG